MTKDRARHPGRRPEINDINTAYVTGKLTKDEANDLSGWSAYGSGETTKNEALTHRRAGLDWKNQ
jgi:hypothetical protein